jgi:hypothetical protein
MLKSSIFNIFLVKFIGKDTYQNKAFDNLVGVVIRLRFLQGKQMVDHGVPLLITTTKKRDFWMV